MHASVKLQKSRRATQVASLLFSQCYRRELLGLQEPAAANVLRSPRQIRIPWRQRRGRGAVIVQRCGLMWVSSPLHRIPALVSICLD